MVPLGGPFIKSWLAPILNYVGITSNFEIIFEIILWIKFKVGIKMSLVKLEIETHKPFRVYSSNVV